MSAGFHCGASAWAKRRAGEVMVLSPWFCDLSHDHEEGWTSRGLSPRQTTQRRMISITRGDRCCASEYRCSAREDGGSGRGDSRITANIDVTTCYVDVDR